MRNSYEYYGHLQKYVTKRLDKERDQGGFSYAQPTQKPFKRRSGGWNEWGK